MAILSDFLCQCQTCQKFMKRQVAEPLKPHMIPDRSWEVLGTDLFVYQGSNYLVIVDYYSKFPIVRKITGKCDGPAIVRTMKQVFSEVSIPKKVISDNGPQFDCEHFRKFDKEWCFDHVTSSPTFPQSNGLAERMVQTVKNIIKKCTDSDSDIDMALLVLRSTPIDNKLQSPSELLCSRKFQCNLPVKITNELPEKDKIKTRLIDRQQTQKHYHDTPGVRELPPLKVGQSVTVLKDNDTWTHAVVKKKCLNLDPMLSKLQMEID